MSTALVHSVAEACAIARIGRTALYQAINCGDLTARKRGRRTLIMAADLERWLKSWPAASAKGVLSSPAATPEPKEPKGGTSKPPGSGKQRRGLA